MRREACQQIACVVVGRLRFLIVRMQQLASAEFQEPCASYASSQVTLTASVRAVDSSVSPPRKMKLTPRGDVISQEVVEVGFEPNYSGAEACTLSHYAEFLFDF